MHMIDASLRHHDLARPQAPTLLLPPTTTVVCSSLEPGLPRIVHLRPALRRHPRPCPRHDRPDPTGRPDPDPGIDPAGGSMKIGKHFEIDYWEIAIAGLIALLLVTALTGGACR